jgi:hypothetical protein
MSTVYYLKWGRLQLDMLDEYNAKPNYSTSESNSHENEINKNDESMDEKKASTYEKKVQYIMIPLQRTRQNNIPSKPYLDKDFTQIDIPEHVHNTLKNMSECFAGKVEEDIYATEIEGKVPDDKSGQASGQVKEMQDTEEPANEKISKLSSEIEEKEIAKEETTEVAKEEKEDEDAAKEKASEVAKEEKEDAAKEKASEVAKEEKEGEEVAKEETSKSAEETKEDKDLVQEVSKKDDETKESKEAVKEAEESVNKSSSEAGDELKETVEIVAEIKNELGIESAKENDKKDIGGEDNMEDMEKDYDVVEEEYNPVNEEEILEKLNPKVEVVDEYDWHEDSYYEQQKIDQLMGHYEQTKSSNLNNSYYDEAKSTENQGVVLENPIKNRGLKSKLKNLFRRKW